MSTKRSQVTRYGPRLTLLNQTKRPFLPGKLPDEMVGPKPHSGLLRLCSKGTNHCRIQTLRYGGPGHPDPEIRGGGRGWLVKKISALRVSVWLKNKGSGAPWPLPWIVHCKQLTPIRRSEIMLKLDTASRHLSNMNTS